MRVKIVLRIVLATSLAMLFGCQRYNAPQSQPNGKLAFYIAPKRASLNQAVLATQEHRLQAGQVAMWWKKSGNQTKSKKEPRYLWLPVEFHTAGYKGLVSGHYKAKRYLLVSNATGQRMIPQGGKKGWGLAQVHAAKDYAGRHVVTFELNRRGAKKFLNLTGANVHKDLAIVVAGKVVGAPELMTKLGAQALIQGPLTSRQAASLARILRSGMH